jgi:hypothetical protein
VLEGEILLDEEPVPRIHRVEVVHRYQPRRQRQHVPPWLIVLLLVAAVMWISPFGAVIAIVMISIFVTAHPTIAIAIGGTVALVIIFALRERRAGRPF